jgi:pimeloyl-ACP methyl ester carboxylesterase
LLLAHGARVVIIDPYALSLDSIDVTFAAMARRVDRVLAKAGVSGALVIAHSQGAGVALRLAAMAPGRVDALYFLDSGALAVNRGPTLSAAMRLVPIITRLPGGRAFVRERFLIGLRRNSGRQEWLDQATIRAYTEPLLASIDRVVAMAARLSKAEEPEPLARVVARVRAPVTVIIGSAPHEADIGPEEMTALAPLGGRVRVERLAGVGHFPHEEAPNELLALITAAPHVVAVGSIGETTMR